MSAPQSKRVAALVGAGRIGLLMDSDPSSATARSHAMALYRSGRFELKYVVEPDAERVALLRRIFPGVQVVERVEELAAKADLEVVTLAAPTALRHEQVRALAGARQLRAIVCEKPLFDAEAQYSSIAEASGELEEVRDKVVVNYLRRFAPGVAAFREEVQSGQWGTPLHAVIRYAKGFRHNGSHAVDLLGFLFDAELASYQVLGERRDGAVDDPSFEARLELSFQTGAATFPAYLVPGDDRCFSWFEADFVFSKGRVELIEFGRLIRKARVTADRLDPEYKALSAPETAETGVSRAMETLYNRLANALDQTQADPARVASALSAAGFATFEAELRNRNWTSVIEQETKRKAK